MTKIVTHSGGFHTDDTFAVATLLLLYPDAEVARTRDPKVIKAGDIVVDVGMEYDRERKRFDHHQEGGAGKRDNGVPYAAFGLVWKEYGTEVCGSKEVADMIEEKLVQSADAFDNGVDLYTATIPGVHPYRIEHVFFALEPTWQEEEKTTDEGFFESVGIAKRILEREITHARARVEAYARIDEVYAATEDKELIVFDEEHTFSRHTITDGLVKYPDVLFAVRKHESGLWQTVAVGDDEHSFETRKPFPAEWSGKRDSKLAEVTGVSDAVFCHNKRFMCIAKSREGAVELARRALEN